ncbi:unnamed protein product [Protopolystoma xenopodis]|uniref:Secreted protein n=1 Tax=Protopolystoma xenopodis TaxID=117903 RepID=A0A3S5BAR4_9PLAT|nr:unnamed protein product [Protopolystoma xenopodis]
MLLLWGLRVAASHLFANAHPNPSDGSKTKLLLCCLSSRLSRCGANSVFCSHIIRNTPRSRNTQHPQNSHQLHR